MSSGEALGMGLSSRVCLRFRGPTSYPPSAGARSQGLVARCIPQRGVHVALPSRVGFGWYVREDNGC